MNATPVTERIQWVGAIDWNLRDFHGFETPHGTSYNAYLVRGDDKTALVDTVKTAFVPELLERITSVCPLEAIDLIVVNHVEPDHNSGLRLVMEACPNARVVASTGGVRGVAEYHGRDLTLEAVGADDVIDLGGCTLRFLPMPMVHWPDSMFTFCPEECCLMPNDAFGQHLASSERFADEVGLEFSIEELTVYYANILMPLGPQVAKAVSKVLQSGWTCRTIAPSHGVIWRERDIPTLIDAYDRLTGGDTYDKLVIAYSTMWGSTDQLAREIADGVAATGVDVKLFDIAVTPYAEMTRHILDARGVLIGSPVLHHGMHARTAGFLQWLAGLKPQGKVAGAFGSFGWSGGATKQIMAKLEELGLEQPFGDLSCKYTPAEEDRAAAREWGRQFGELVLERGKTVE